MYIYINRLLAYLDRYCNKKIKYIYLFKFMKNDSRHVTVSMLISVWLKKLCVCVILF